MAGCSNVNSLSEGVASLQIGNGTSNGTVTGTSGVLTVTGTINAQSGSVSAILAGSNGLAKTTSGSISLSASNGYTGATTITAGTLRANNGASNGSATGTTNITVAASTTSGNYTGGMLGGNGVVSGTVTLTGNATAKLGGIIGAGADNTSAGIGTLTTGNETWNGGAAYQWKINAAGTANTPGNVTTLSGTAGTSYDLLQISPSFNSATSLLTITGNTTGVAAFTIAPSGNLTGNISLGSTNTYNWELAQIGSGNATKISINGIPFGNSTSTNLLTATSGAFALDTSALNVGSSNGSLLNANNFSLYFETISGNNDLVLSYNAAPEPGTGLLVVVGVLPLIAKRRRRR